MTVCGGAALVALPWCFPSGGWRGLAAGVEEPATETMEGNHPSAVRPPVETEKWRLRGGLWVEEVDYIRCVYLHE